MAEFPLDSIREYLMLPGTVKDPESKLQRMWTADRQMITLQIIILCWFTAHADLAPSISNHGSHVQNRGRQELFTQWVPVRLNMATHIVNVESLSRSEQRLEKLMQEKCTEDKDVEGIHLSRSLCWKQVELGRVLEENRVYVHSPPSLTILCSHCWETTYGTSWIWYHYSYLLMPCNSSL